GRRRDASWRGLMVSCIFLLRPYRWRGRVSRTLVPRTTTPAPQAAGAELAAPSRNSPPAIVALLITSALLHAPPQGAAETVIAGGVSSGSTNLWPVQIGIRKGLFQAVDINVDLVFAQSNASVIQQLAANSINISVGSGLVDPIRAIEKGAPVALIRIETQRPPYALLAKPVLKSIADLKGK